VKQLFVVMPFGLKPYTSTHAPATSTTIDFDEIYRGIIQPAAQQAGVMPLRADELLTNGRVSEQVLQQLLLSELALVDVSTPNPNVYYELGIRQSVSAGPTLLTAIQGSGLPFDIRDLRVLKYAWPQGPQDRFVEKLARAIRDAEAASKNPIRSYLEAVHLTTNPKVDDVAFERDLHGRLERATTTRQLLALWGWAKSNSKLPAFWLLALGRQLFTADQREMAVEAVQRAVEEKPDDYEVHRQLGWYLRKLPRPRNAQAMRALRRAIELNPSDPEALALLGGLLKRGRRFALALGCYERALQLSPRDPYLQINCASLRILASPTRPEQGQALYREVLDTPALSEPAHADEWQRFNRAEVHFALQRHEEARELYLAAAREARKQTTCESAIEQLELFERVGFESVRSAELTRALRAVVTQRFAGPRSAAILKPTSPQVAGNRLPILLHLSDVHFGTRKDVDMHRFSASADSYTLVDHLAREFDAKKGHFPHHEDRLHLVISGDLTYTGTESEFDRVLEFLTELCQRLRIPKQRVHLTPGNHDISWAACADNPAKRFDNYVALLEEFYGRELFPQRYPHVKRKTFGKQVHPEPYQLVGFHVDPDSGLAITTLNSCVYEDQQEHFGYIGKRQMDFVADWLAQSPAAESLVRVAVLHHHLHPFPEPLEPKKGSEVQLDMSTIRDAGFVEQRLEQLRFDVVLHGHKHKPQLRETLIRTTGSTGPSASKLIVCGAGSTGVSRAELEHAEGNHYIEVLRAPREPGVGFITVEWRELAVTAGADWRTSARWNVTG
jgi:3',5'-cyclic AMP phosphodiesterase CpdA/Tfp pilus assembly protein PilF